MPGNGLLLITAGRWNMGCTRSGIYEEMVLTESQLKSGVSESQAFYEFGSRCGLQPYMKLAALLEQSRKNGARSLRERLRLEMADAFEQRKHQARRLGRKPERDF